MKRFSSLNTPEIKPNSRQEGLVSVYKINQKIEEEVEEENRGSNLISKKVGKHFNKNFVDRFNKIERELKNEKGFFIFAKRQAQIYVKFFENIDSELNERTSLVMDKTVVSNKNNGLLKRDTYISHRGDKNSSDFQNFGSVDKKKEVARESTSIIFEQTEIFKTQSGPVRKPEGLSKSYNNIKITKFNQNKNERKDSERIDECATERSGLVVKVLKKSTQQSSYLQSKRKNQFNLDGSKELETEERPAKKITKEDPPKHNNTTNTSKSEIQPAPEEGFRGLATALRASLRQSSNFNGNMTEIEKPTQKNIQRVSYGKIKSRKGYCDEFSKPDSGVNLELKKMATMRISLVGNKCIANEYNKINEQESENSIEKIDEEDQLPLQLARIMISPTGNYQFGKHEFRMKVGDKMENCLYNLEDSTNQLESTNQSLETGFTVTSSLKFPQIDSKSDDENPVFKKNKRKIEKTELVMMADSYENFKPNQNLFAKELNENNWKQSNKAKQIKEDDTRNTKNTEEVQTQNEKDELEEKHRKLNEEIKIRKEAREQKKKLRKELQNKLKSKMLEIIVQIMPKKSKLPTLFMNSQKAESFLLLDSVKLSINRSIDATKLEIEDLKSQYEQFDNFEFETLEDDFPFYVSNLSVVSLKTISENEIKEVLVSEKLSAEMLNVLRVFYFAHFEVYDFESWSLKGPKQLLIEIVEFYSEHLKTMTSKESKPFRFLDFDLKIKLEQFLKSNKSLFLVISDTNMNSFLHSICFYTFEILFYYGMKPYVKFMEKPKDKENNKVNSAYHLGLLINKLGFYKSQLEEFIALKNQYEPNDLNQFK